MRSFLAALVCGLFLVPPASAQILTQSDLAVVSGQVDKTALVTGERFTVTARVRNNGAALATNVAVFFGTYVSPFTLSIQGPAGWTCRWSAQPAGTPFCRIDSLAVFAEAEFTAVLLAPPTVPAAPLSAHVTVSSGSPDPNRENNSRTFPLTVGAANSIADLEARVMDDVRTREGILTDSIASVTNHGSAAVRDVWLAIRTESSFAPAYTAAGAGWTCTATPPQPGAMLCRASTILPGETLAVRLRFTAPREEGSFAFFVRAQAEGNRDDNAANDSAYGTVYVGSLTNWRRILLPVTQTNVPGANGSLWKTEITMLLRNVGAQDIKPHPCDREIITCFGPPQNRPFDGSAFVLDPSWPGGQFLYVRTGRENDVDVNIRIYDASRMTETAGAEIPVVRPGAINAGTVLLGIPVAPEYRHTLRIYEAAGFDMGRVLINVYAGEETEPRASVVRTVAQSPVFELVTPARLPSHPGYLQLELGSLLPLDSLKTLRVEVEPLDLGMQIWGFVSIVNNDTHHVTTVTPQ